MDDVASRRNEPGQILQRYIPDAGGTDLEQMIPRTQVFHLLERADESLPLAVLQHWKVGKAMISLEAAHNTSTDRLLLC